MRIVLPRESVAGEHRTSATPETVKKMIRLGAEVAIESGAGAAVAAGGGMRRRNTRIRSFTVFIA